MGLDHLLPPTEVHLSAIVLHSTLGDVGSSLGLPAHGEKECASLPSGQAAFELVHGDLSALPRVLAHTALRATLIGVGAWLVGADRRTLVRDAIAGSLGIDAFVIGWALLRKTESKAQA